MSTENTTERRDPRAMLAEIALASELPVPEVIYLYSDSGILALNLATLADGRAWSRHLGGSTDSYLNGHNGRRYLDEGRIRWHGWSVQLHASEPSCVDVPLAEDTAARLAKLASA